MEQIIFSVSLESLSSFRVILRLGFCLSRYLGREVFHISFLVMNSVSTIVSAIFFTLIYSLLPKDLTS